MCVFSIGKHFVKHLCRPLPPSPPLSSSTHPQSTHAQPVGSLPYNVCAPLTAVDQYWATFFGLRVLLDGLDLTASCEFDSKVCECESDKVG